MTVMLFLLITLHVMCEQFINSFTCKTMKKLFTAIFFNFRNKTTPQERAWVDTHIKVRL